MQEQEQDPQSRPTAHGMLGIAVMIVLGLFVLCILASIAVAILRSWF